MGGFCDRFISEHIEPHTMTYNGYENFDTWCAVSWLTNTQKEYDIATIQLAHLTAQGIKGDDLKLKLANWFKENLQTRADYVRRLYSDPEKAYEQIIIDLMNASIERINWFEVADAFLDE